MQAHIWRLRILERQSAELITDDLRGFNSLPKRRLVRDSDQLQRVQALPGTQRLLPASPDLQELGNLFI